MCGIIGGWTSQPLPNASIEASLDSIIHRGPDDAGLLRDDSAFIGMRRLSIIDLEGGKQPISNEDGTVSVVCNGEIYNYRELRQTLKQQGHTFRTDSDTEVLVHLYEEYGDQLCDPLRGMYGFAIWDARNRSLLLGRDRFGKKPLYYTHSATTGFLFATELKALRPLIDSTGSTLQIREQSVSDYLSLGCVPQPNTIFENVFAVPEASTLKFDGQDITTNRYWRIDYQQKTSLSYPEVLERTRDLISEAVRLRLRSDVPLGVFLSGGVDSTVVAYEAAQAVGETLHTFTVGVDDEDFDESPVAVRTAQQFGVRNTVLRLKLEPQAALKTIVQQYDQPFADPSAIPSLAVSKLAREHVAVVLNGDGGDEVFAGYRRHMAARLSGIMERLPSSANSMVGRVLSRLSTGRRSALGFATRLFQGAALPGGEQYLSWSTDRFHQSDKSVAWSGGNVEPTESWLTSIIPDNLSGLDRLTYSDIHVNLLSALLVKMDIATMAHSLEGRSPLLDHELAEFVATLPESFRIRGRQLKSPLRDAYRGLIPDEVIRGKKRGFEIPLAGWLQGDLHELLHDSLGSNDAYTRSILNGRFVQEMLDQQRMTNRNWSTAMYSLLVLELWLRDFHANNSRLKVAA